MDEEDEGITHRARHPCWFLNCSLPPSPHLPPPFPPLLLPSRLPSSAHVSSSLPSFLLCSISYPLAYSPLVFPFFLFVKRLLLILLSLRIVARWDRGSSVHNPLVTSPPRPLIVSLFPWNSFSSCAETNYYYLLFSVLSLPADLSVCVERFISLSVHIINPV